MLAAVLEGRRIAPGASPGRKVRTPQVAMLRNPGLFDRDTRRRSVGRRSDGKCHRKLNRHRRKPVVRVKRWCKRPPREAQATRHGKPRRVQGQIGNRGVVRSGFRESETGFGYRSLRQMILSVRKGADRIRLTALPKPLTHLSGGGRPPQFLKKHPNDAALRRKPLPFQATLRAPGRFIFSVSRPPARSSCRCGRRRG